MIQVCQKTTVRQIFCQTMLGLQSCCYCCYSVTKSCMTLCEFVSYRTPGFSVDHYIPEFAQTHLHWVSDTSQPSHSVSSFSSWPQSFSSSGSFLISQFFSSGGQSIGTSATASVLSMNIQHWFPLRLSDLISLLSKGLSRVFSSTTVQTCQFFFIYLPLIFPTSVSSLL